MRGTTMDGVTDWIEFIDPVNDTRRFNVNVNFLLSNYNCIYGRGCPGEFAVQDVHIESDSGCCRGGCYFSDKEDFEHTQKMVKQLTDADWDKAQSNFVTKNGWYHKVGIEHGAEEAPYKTKTNDFACVFNNRANGSLQKPGCAFHHLANRLGVSHVETKPFVCWSIPLRVEDEETIDGGNYVTIRAWDADDWGINYGDDEESDQTMRWWCTDTPDAYTGSVPLYKSSEVELRKVMGSQAYELLVKLLEARTGVPAPMPGAVRNEGRPLLPLLIGSRTPRRLSKEAHDAQRTGSGSADKGV